MKRIVKLWLLAALGSPVGLGRWAKRQSVDLPPPEPSPVQFGAMAALGGALYNIPSPLRAAFSAGLGVDPETEMRKLLSGKLGLPDMATEVGAPRCRRYCRGRHLPVPSTRRYSSDRFTLAISSRRSVWQLRSGQG